MSVIAGLINEIYYLSSGTPANWGSSLTSGVYIAAPPSNLVALTSVRNANLKLNVGEGDASSRISNVKLTILTLEEWQVDLEIPYNPSAADFMFLRAARVQRIPIVCACLDNLSTVSGAFGIWAPFIVSQFEKDEPLDKETMTKITLKPTSGTFVPQWVQVM